MRMEVREMLSAYCQSHDPALRNALAEEYLYLAQAVARRFWGRGAEMDDLVQVASIALLHALERFDCSMGLSFTTFAVPTLAGEVRNYLRDKSRAVRLPRRGSEMLPRLLREREAFFREHGREPSAAELAQVLGIQADDVLDALEMQRASQPVSLDAPLSADGSALENLLGQGEEDFAEVEQRDMIDSFLTELTGPSRYVIEERFLRQRSQREIAKDLGVSQMQVSRIERRALASLREKMA